MEPKLRVGWGVGTCVVNTHEAVAALIHTGEGISIDINRLEIEDAGYGTSPPHS